MIIFKRIEIDLEKERKRIREVSYSSRQRAALLFLVDLFEQGKWQECLNHVNNKKAFPYNKKEGYPEREHIGVEISHILNDLPFYNYYTREELLNQAKASLKMSK